MEKTLPYDIVAPHEAIKIINDLYELLQRRIQEHAADLMIKNQFIKIKNSEFKLFSAETKSNTLCLQSYLALFQKTNPQSSKPIRLLGIGVHFQHEAIEERYYQPSLFTDTDACMRYDN